MLTKQDIANLFKGWKRLFRTKMKDTDWDIETLLIWHVALNDLSMTNTEFENAMRKSLTLTWPPTAPANFLELARADVVSNYLDVRQAYIDAANFNYADDIVYETARRVGFASLRSDVEYRTYPIWIKTYRDVCIAHSRGENFPVNLSHQIEHKTSPVAIENAITDESIAKLRAIVAGE